MKTLRAAYETALESGVTTLAWCLRIERTDGVVLRFTSHDRSILMSNGTVYAPDQGSADVTAVRQESDLQAATFDLESALVPNGVARADLAAGLFDHAALYLFRTLWDDPVEDDEAIAKGYWGQAELRDERYVTEFRSLATLLEQETGRVHGSTCDADLGDSRCKVDLAALTVSGTVTGVTDAGEFTDSNRTEADDYFGAGLVAFTSGANAGIEREVDNFSGGTFGMWQAFPFAIAVGDTYEAKPGCRKRFQADCIDKFDNAINHQGFPHLPGRDAVNKFGGQ